MRRSASGRRPWSRRWLTLTIGALIVALIVPVAALAGARFNDVRAGQTHASSIGWVADAGVTLGCNPAGTIYCPDDPVSRAQMASFMRRLAEAGVVDAATLGGLSASELSTVNEGRINLGNNTTIAASNTVQHVRDLGTFTKRHASTRLEVTFTTHAYTGPTSSCRWQLRIDGRNAAGSTFTTGGLRLDGYEQFLTNTAEAYRALTFAPRFTGISAGSHTLQLWVEGASGSQCFHNPGNFPRAWRVTELH